MNFKVSKMNLQDLESIKSILVDSFDDFWNYNILKQELECKDSYFLIAKSLENEIVGFAGLKIILDEADIMNIVVKKNFRGQNIGSLLLENLIIYSKSKNLKTITLEVNEHNLYALNLYKKFNFDTVGIRKKYYDGKDTAIIMNKKLVNIG